MPEMSSLGVFFGIRSSLLFRERAIQICRKKKYHLYRSYRKHHISMYFLRKVIFHFPSVEKISYFWEKEMPSFLMIGERSCSSVIFLERPSFQNIWKRKTWFFVQCEVLMAVNCFLFLFNNILVLKVHISTILKDSVEMFSWELIGRAIAFQNIEEYFLFYLFHSI